MVVILVAGTILVMVRFGNLYWKPNRVPGVVDGRLVACPDRPNCVSTQTEDPRQHMPPVRLERPANDVIGKLTRIVEAMPRARVVSSGDGYLHAEFQSLVFGFVDDVEFLVDESEQLLHFRSASRIGYSDFGVNRRRMEKILRRLQVGI